MPNNNLGNRVSEAEQQIATLAASQRAMAEKVTSLASSVESGFSKTDSKIDLLSSKIGEMGRPRWEALGTMFAIAVAVIGWFVTSHVGPLQSAITVTREDTERVERRIDSHPERLAKLEAWYELYVNGHLTNAPGAKP